VTLYGSLTETGNPKPAFQDAVIVSLKAVTLNYLASSQ
jgi:hypothetical protein